MDRHDIITADDLELYSVYKEVGSIAYRTKTTSLTAQMFLLSTECNLSWVSI